MKLIKTTLATAMAVAMASMALGEDTAIDTKIDALLQEGEESYGRHPHHYAGGYKSPSSSSYGEPSYGKRPSYGDKKDSYRPSSGGYGYKPSSSSYGEPSYGKSPSYGDKKDSYRPRSGGYGYKPSSSYGKNDPSYGKNDPSYGKSPSYGDKKDSYRPSSGGYGGSYQPSSSYGKNDPSYDSPRGHYGGHYGKKHHKKPKIEHVLKESQRMIMVLKDQLKLAEKLQLKANDLCIHSIMKSKSPIYTVCEFREEWDSDGGRVLDSAAREYSECTEDVVKNFCVNTLAEQSFEDFVPLSNPNPTVSIYEQILLESQ